MRVALIQMDIVCDDASRNRAMAEKLMHTAPGAQLYVLPEMFTTGFTVNPDGVAEQDGGDTLQWMIHMASKFDAAITASVPVRTNSGHCHNRLYFVTPDGRVEYYDKRHLFTYGGEDKAYTCGDRRVVLEWRGVKFLLQVCYDLRFPVFSRNVMKCNDMTDEKLPLYDCCIYVASWPESRRKPWDVLLRARAIENQCYVLGVNRVGDDLQCHYNGGTVVVDAYGKDVVMASDDKAMAIVADIDIERLKNFRQKFPVLLDGDYE